MIVKGSFSFLMLLIELFIALFSVLIWHSTPSSVYLIHILFKFLSFFPPHLCILINNRV